MASILKVDQIQTNAASNTVLISPVLSGGLGLQVTKTADYTILDNDYYSTIFVDSSARAINITLPSAASNVKKKLQIANIGFASSNAAIQFNSNSITANQTIPSGQNAVSAGPISIADSITVTVTDGSSWVIV